MDKALRIIVVVLLLSLASQAQILRQILQPQPAAGVTITLVQNPNGVLSSQTTQTVTFGSKFTVGNLVVVYVAVGPAGRTFTCTDNATTPNTYTQDNTHSNTSDSHTSYVFHSIITNAAGTANTVSCTVSGAATFIGMIIAEFSKSTAWTGLDKTAGNDDDNTPNGNIDSTATAATTVADELVIGTAGLSGSGTAITPGGSYADVKVLLNSGFLDAYMAYLVVHATGAQQFTATANASNRWDAMVMTYK